MNVPVHPARFPADLPLFFISLLTDPGDVVVDIFAGSNVTGWVCEHTNRQWLGFDLDCDYVAGSRFRFDPACPPPTIDRVGAREPNPIRPVRIQNGPAKLSTGEKRINGNHLPTTTRNGINVSLKIKRNSSTKDAATGFLWERAK